MKEKRESLIKGRILEKQLSRTYRFLIFLILFLISIIIKSSEMAISLQKFGKILKIYNNSYSIYYKTGIILGNILFIIISQIENRKKVTFISFLLNGILYFIYSFTKTKEAFDTIIFFISILKDYKDIIIPIWIDQFCIKKYKTAFMYIYLTNMIGYILELLMIFIIYSNEWHINAIIFKIFGGLVIIFDCLLLFFPNKYFSFKYNFIGYKVKDKEEFTKIENSGQSSFFGNQEDNNINNNEIGFLKIILNYKIYVLSVLYNLSCLYYFQIIGNNILDYGMVFLIFKKLKKSSSYTIGHYYLNCIKFGGMILGGICLLCIGGYEKINSLKMLRVYKNILFFCSLIIFLFSSSLFILGILYILIFFCSVPLLTINKCFIVNSIPNKYKGSGVALSLLLGNIIQIVGFIFIKLALNLNSNFIINIPLIIFFLLSYIYINYKKEIEINKSKEKELEDVKKV